MFAPEAGYLSAHVGYELRRRLASGLANCQRHEGQWAQLQALADLFQLIQGDATATAFELAQVGATRVTKVPLGNIPLAPHVPQHGRK